jgi:molybdate transport system substrate-binding protein
LKNVVSYENNVRAVLSKVALGEADAGVVYSTDAKTAADKVTVLEVPDAFNVIALYPVAVVRDAVNPSAANAWIAYLLSAEGQAVLAKYGFVPPS